LKGSSEIVELFREAVEKHGLMETVTLSGSFCIGKCNRIGVTVQIDDEIHTGVTKESFNDFFNENVLKKIERI